MKNEATRSSLEKTDRAVVENMKNLAQLMGAVLKARNAYLSEGCAQAADAYEAMLPAIDGVLEAFDRANTAAVMAHKNLAGVGVPAPAQREEPRCPRCGCSEDAPNNHDLCENCVDALGDRDEETMTDSAQQDEIPAFMVGQQMEMD